MGPQTPPDPRLISFPPLSSSAIHIPGGGNGVVGVEVVYNEGEVILDKDVFHFGLEGSTQGSSDSIYVITSLTHR